MFPLGRGGGLEGAVEVVWSSAAAGLVVTIAASLAILGATRAVDSRRAGHIVPAGLFSRRWGCSARCCWPAAVVLGFVVMTSK